MRQHLITDVLPGSPAQKAGICPGQRLCLINGQPVQDCIDYTFLTADDRCVMTLVDERGRTRRKKLRRPPGQGWGLVFETDLMDDIRVCRNHCIFCFVDQQPPGLRSQLMLKDDDWRLSFLMGSYVTLTNLSDSDWQRILALKPSPLYISVHAADPQVRCALLRNPHAGELMQHMHTLAAAGIRMHAQAVICPGVNDGRVLDDTIAQLAQLHPYVLSLAVVPVGLTGHRQGLEPLAPFTPQQADALLDQLHQAQQHCRRTLGATFVHPADELYLLAGRPIPPLEDYDDNPQFEDGVGLTATLQQELQAALPEITPGTGRQTLVTGELAAPLLQRWIDALPAGYPQTRVIAVQNQLMGRQVTVAGLLCGQDVARALAGQDLGDRVLIPAVMLRDGGQLTLDGWTLDQLQQAAGRPVVPVENDGRSLALALAMADTPAEQG